MISKINSFLRFCILPLAFALSIPAFSQSDNDSLATTDIMDFLPPLSVIIDSALANSPEVGYFESIMESTEYDVSLEKKSWANDIRFQGGYNWTYGNQLLLPGVGTGEATSNEGYNYGVVISIPLSTWYTRSDRVKRAEALRGGQQAKVDQASVKIREEVITTYNQLLLMQRLLKISSESKESSELILEEAEKKFKDGEIGLEELVGAADYRTRSAMEYEQNRTAFNNAYTALERLAGVPFSKMKKN
tara:strand:- start:714 stop:1454 length:741 start_codon:yes stop_codon:yes gene_type:complete